MKQIILTISTLLIFILPLTACSSQKPQNIISNELGIDASSGNEVSSFDNHGGFHGDGTAYIALSFSDNTVLEQIQESTQYAMESVSFRWNCTSIGVWGIRCDK